MLGVCKLITRTYSIIQGKHNKKTAAFARACIAYCYITIPMMDGYLDRLFLYSLSGQLAVLNQSLHQAEVTNTHSLSQNLGEIGRERFTFFSLNTLLLTVLNLSSSSAAWWCV